MPNLLPTGTSAHPRMITGPGVAAASTSPAAMPGAVAIGVVVAVGAYVSMFLLMPSARPRLATEDGVIEAATAVLFLGAAAVGSVGVLRSGATRIHSLIPIVGLLGFLDEMRFGARIFGFSPPSVNEVEVDSFHDVLTVADRLASDLGLIMAGVVLDQLGSTSTIVFAEETVELAAGLEHGQPFDGRRHRTTGASDPAIRPPTPRSPRSR